APAAPAPSAAAQAAEAAADERAAPPTRAPRPAAAAQRGLLHAVLDQRDDQEAHEDEPQHLPPAESVGGLAAVRPRPALGHAGDRAVDGAEAGADAVGEAPFAEARGHDVAQDRRRDRVGELTLEAVADLEPGSPVVEEDQEDDAVVEALLADSPGLGQPDR